MCCLPNEPPPETQIDDMCSPAIEQCIVDGGTPTIGIDWDVLFPRSPDNQCVVQCDLPPPEPGEGGDSDG